MNMGKHKSALVALVAYILTGFVSQLSAADRLRVAYSAVNASQSYLWVAQEMGFYRKHGFEVDLLYINSGSMNIAALLGGSIQIAGGGPVSVEARLRGIKLLILANPMPLVAANWWSIPISK
jgi:ABC-type nitrate/sulfonate/bicarbonate transport system substrate-binding protein